MFSKCNTTKLPIFWVIFSLYLNKHLNTLLVFNILFCKKHHLVQVPTINLCHKEMSYKHSSIVWVFFAPRELVSLLRLFYNSMSFVCDAFTPDPAHFYDGDNINQFLKSKKLLFLITNHELQIFFGSFLILHFTFND